MPKIITASTGDIFGCWEFVCELEPQTYPCGQTKRIAKARCLCGNEQILDLYGLIRRNGSSCKKCNNLSKIIGDGSLFIGEKFGKWTVIKSNVKIKKAENRYAHALVVMCDCGLVTKVRLNSLLNGKSRQCVHCASKKHGMTSTPEYNVWCNMLQRCYNPNSTSYKNYGGAGVTVCDRWNPSNGGSFENFYKDVGKRPSPDHQLDKEAVVLDNKVYAPRLAKWVNSRDNSKRRKGTHRIEICGNLFTCTDAAILIGSSRHTVLKYIKMGFSIYEIPGKGYGGLTIAQRLELGLLNKNDISSFSYFDLKCQ